MQSKLLITESQKAELAKSLRQKEQLIAALEQQTSNLSQEMEKVHQFHASSSQLLQLTLMEIEERLEAVEQGQRESSQRIIEQIHMIQERSESSNLRE